MCRHIALLILLSCCFACRQQKKAPIADKPLPGTEVNTHMEMEYPLYGVNNQPVDTSEIKALLDKGNNLRQKEPDSALLLYRQALYLSRKSNYNKGTVTSLYNMACIYEDKNNYKQARNCYNLALPYSYLSVTQDKTSLPKLYYCLGGTYFYDYNFDSALYMFYRSLTLLEKKYFTDTQLLMQVYIGVSGVMQGMDKHNDRSFQYLYKALPLAVHLKDSSSLALIFKNIGVLHIDNNSLDSALYALNHALWLYKALRRPDEIQELYSGMSDIWLHKDDMLNGKIYRDSALKVNNPYITSHFRVALNLAHIYSHTGDFKDAARYLEQVLALSEKQKKAKSTKLNIYAMLARVYDTIGKGHLAYVNLMKYAILKDSIMDDDKIGTLNQMEVKYQTSEKEKMLVQKQLLIARQQNNIQQLYLYIGGAFIIILILAGLFYRKQHLAAIAQFKANLAGQEGERLRMASELHDGIVSKLSSVKWSFHALAPTTAVNTVDVDDFNEAMQLLDQSITELRTTSQNLQPSILEKAGLAAAIVIYCQKINKISPLHLDFELTGSLPALKKDFQLNIYRIIQELVNNIIKHAQATQAAILFNVESGRLCITVEDNGVGMPQEVTNDQNGIGFYNLQHRLKLLNGHMNITTGKGTAVQLDFELKYHTA